MSEIYISFAHGLLAVEDTAAANRCSELRHGVQLQNLIVGCMYISDSPINGAAQDTRPERRCLLVPFKAASSTCQVSHIFDQVTDFQRSQLLQTGFYHLTAKRVTDEADSVSEEGNPCSQGAG